MTFSQPPAWVYEANFYQIFPDRFAKSLEVEKPGNLESWESPPTLLGFKGGDLIGVCDKLDYLKELGFNAIYFCPVFASTANHRYHTHDFFQIDPILGGNKAFTQLLEAAHARGMRVVLDGVFNHVSRGFLQFNHALENGRFSPYRDWFKFNDKLLERDDPLPAYEPVKYVRKAPDGLEGFNRFGYEAWWDLPALPKFNTDNKQVQDFILRVAKFWLEQGIDGWRLDVPTEITTPGFWEKFRQVARDTRPDCYLLGEIWYEAPDWVKGDRFDAVMNYHLGKVILGYFLRACLNKEALAISGLRSVSALTFEQFLKELTNATNVYKPATQLAQMNLLASHDTPRLLTMASGNASAAKLATAFMYLCPGAPCVYYGEEIGMQGEHDPGCRGAFPERFTERQEDYLTNLKPVLRWRQHPAVQRGSFEVVAIQEDVFFVRRRYESSELAVLFNASDSPFTWTSKHAQEGGLPPLANDVVCDSMGYLVLTSFWRESAIN